jgi:hypothetical protein
VAGRHHHPITNQRAAGESPQLHGLAGIIDTPDHDHADVGVPVLVINGCLSRECRCSRQQRDAPGDQCRADHWFGTNLAQLILLP